jgi:hypothetical protein
MPTTTWEPDTQVTDHLLFPIEAELSGWQLRIGVVAADGQLVPLSDSPGEDFLLLTLD